MQESREIHAIMLCEVASLKLHNCQSWRWKYMCQNICNGYGFTMKLYFRWNVPLGVIKNYS